jgi:hypothetical protein
MGRSISDRSGEGHSIPWLWAEAPLIGGDEAPSLGIVSGSVLGLDAESWCFDGLPRVLTTTVLAFPFSSSINESCASSTGSFSDSESLGLRPLLTIAIA